ncbi:MAG: hypothetical protein ACXACO_10955 [Promethearchaeota archaeon]
MDTIYTYKTETEDSPPIVQGDIFYNLPIRSFDLITKSISIEKKPLENQTNLILEEIALSGKYILTESFIYPSWGILASQDCDIRPDFDLIFYPLIETKGPEDVDNTLDNFLKQNIRETTRKYYLPKLKPPHLPEFGPSYVLLQSPFVVPYNLLIKENIYKKSWCARINDPARRVFLGKLTNFYCRTPMDEYIFLTNSEITKLIEEYWKKLSLKDSIKKLFEIKDALLFNKRKSDIQNILFINQEFVRELRNYIKHLFFGKEDNEFIQISDEIQGSEPKIANSKFIDLIQKVYFNENCLLNQMDSPIFNEKLGIIQELKEGKYIIDIVPEELKDNKEEITRIGYRAEKSVKMLKRQREVMDEYIKLIEIVLIN